MDYRDAQTGTTKDYFWFEAKDGLIEVLFGKVKGQGPLKILNLGAGTGRDIEIVRRFGQVYVVDIDPRALDLIPDELVVEKKAVDARSLPYPDGFFDRVAAFDVLEHIEKDEEAIREIRRVLKKGGSFIFTVPAFPFLYSAHDKALDHFRRYDRRALEGQLSGFDLIETGYWVCSLFPLIAAFRLLKRNDPAPKVGLLPLPRAVDRLFFYLLKAENRLIEKGVHLPFGVTLYGICRKP
ncbi:MAG: hypothetical protein A3A86_04295 [Elusimicrobia bacterium RIFCSPLOWO2_01_FULL_60_11]|nr:MAG: hypothetical protein A3A86_04295 [Elusimicrobia bacterium RIFCSPLOWO2_01_FULL_60_11]